ncbi:MAG: hypothetical protein A2Z14_10195 [Chloroflexi bacterium RBG_16_48_8]|nr:MAG: hypothetical protein A2Z14_10195 [Chloroflexi bacterium RBG_16_48_8]
MKTESIKPQHNPLPWHGWLGIASMAIAEILLLSGSKFVATWMTPIMWTGYIFTMDAVLFVLQGRSWLKNRLREVPFLILVSVGVWVLFEIYNFHLKNWQYVGLPANVLLRDIGFFWSFATIMPGIFITSELLNALLTKTAQKKVGSSPPTQLAPRDWGWLSLGLLMVTTPLFLKEEIATYLFALIWLGYIPLLDPINKRLGAPTIACHWKQSNRQFMLILLAAGFICGLLWEAWNYQAFQAKGAIWVYTIPQSLRIFGLHYGKMPLLGLLGFPPFALELYAFYQLFRKCFGGDRIFGSRSGMMI